MGSHLLIVRAGGPTQRRAWDIKTLVEADLLRMRQLPHVAAAFPEFSNNYTLRYGNADANTDVIATGYQYPEARKWRLAEGTFFTQEDEAAYAPVVVLGQGVAYKLFEDQSPLGRFIMLKNVLFQVIGVMETKGADASGQDQDDRVFIPYTTGGLRIMGQRHYRSITLSITQQKHMHSVQTALKAQLLERHGEEDFTLRNMASVLETLSQTQNTLTLLLSTVAAISLIVGGIGVMNILLVSVTERTQEIGLRMATGAHQRHILQQFLLEAVFISALGGVLGVLLGFGATALFQIAGTPVVFALTPVLLAFGCAFCTGLIFGYLPARKASQLQPVVALAAR